MLFSVYAFAQPNIEWRNTYGGAGHEYGTSICTTPDHEYAITGITSTFGAGSGDVFLLKTSSSGEILWFLTYGGAGRDFGQCVRNLENGGFIIAGYTESFGMGNNDVYIIRTDNVGDTLWTRSFGGPGWDIGCSVVPTEDGGFMIVGTTLSFGSGGADIYIIRTDANGDSLWSSTYGFTGYEKGYSICNTNDGCFAISGYTNSYGSGSADVLLMKIDANGSLLWVKNFGGNDFEEGICTRQLSDAGFIICGRTGSFGAGGDDVFVIRTDENGDSLWANTYGGFLNDEGFSLVETNDGGFIITGRTESSAIGDYDVLLMKIDSAGNELWNRSIGGMELDWGIGIEITSDSSYIITGATESFGNGGYDMFMLEFSEDQESLITSSRTTESFDLSFDISPNPFNQSTVISYILPKAGPIGLSVYNVTGREEVKLVNGYQSSGNHEVIFQAKYLASGVYFLKLNTGELEQVRKIIIIK